MSSSTWYKLFFDDDAFSSDLLLKLKLFGKAQVQKKNLG